MANELDDIRIHSPLKPVVAGRAGLCIAVVDGAPWVAVASFDKRHRGPV